MLRVSPNVLWHDLEAELVLLNTQTGRYYGLDPIGGFIFRALANNQPLPELVEALTRKYDVEADFARAEVERLIRDLSNAKLLTDETAAP